MSIQIASKFCAIAAGGSTCWELAFMGLPSLVLILADNQRSIAEKIGTMGVAVNLGWHENVGVGEMARAITSLSNALAQLLVKPGDREEMSRQGQVLVDGEGSSRVLMQLESKVLSLRPVREDDCRLLWEWANDPDVRASAFSSEPIPWESHVHWFTQKLHAPNCHMFIVLDSQDTPIGQVRFDTWDNEQAEIDVSIHKEKRSSGYGSLLIDTAVQELFRLTSIQAVHALIKPDNKASIRVFEKAQFHKIGMETVKGNLALHYRRVKSNAQ